jgi:hypothetical protein
MRKFWSVALPFSKVACAVKVIYSIPIYVTDLILAVVELLGRDISRLVVEARETLESVEL